MNTIIAIDRKGKPRNFSAPAAWNEVTEKQLVAWAALTLKTLDIEDVTRLAMGVFYGMPLWVFSAMPEAWKVQIAPTLRFLFGQNMLTKWVIGELSVKRWFFWKQRFYGPESRLENITIGEYSKTELYYQVYVKRDDARALDLLIATLYRPKRKGVIDKDIRQGLTEMGIRKRAAVMRKLPEAYRQAILLNYEGCRNFIKINFLDKLPSDGGGNPEDLFDFNKLILAIAGGEGKFGHKTDTEKAMLYDFLQHMVSTAEEIARMKAKH